MASTPGVVVLGPKLREATTGGTHCEIVGSLKKEGKKHS